MQLGKESGDPRSTGLGLGLLSLIALTSASYAEGLDYAERSLSVAITPIDRSIATSCKAGALVLLRRVNEGEAILADYRTSCLMKGEHYPLPIIDAQLGVCEVLRGNFAKGIERIEKTISFQKKVGYVGSAYWFQLLLAEIYLEMLAGKQRPPFLVLLKNLPVLIKATITGPARILSLTTPPEYPQYERDGFYAGQVEMIRGLLDAKKRHSQAIHHLTEAKRILSQFGKTPILARVETALAELGRQP
jgi:hypothetical protein